MKVELTEVTFIDERANYTLADLAERSHLAPADIVELIDCGALAADSGRALETARTAARLRRDFEVNVQGVALAMTLLQRIADLEGELRTLRAHTPGTP